MSLKRKIALTGSLLFLLALLMVSLLTGLFFYLPHYLESKIIPQLAADAGISDFAVDVRNIGFFDADLGTLRIGPEQNPSFVIRSVQVDYSPRELYRQKIKKITFSGIELTGDLINGQFKLRGVDIEKLLAGLQQREKPPTAPDDPLPLVSVARLEIRNSFVIVVYDDQIYRVPFELSLIPQDPEYNLLNVEANLYLRGQKITATIRVNRPDRRAALHVESFTLNLGRFADITSRFGDLTMSGKVTMLGMADLRWQPLRISSVNASLTLRKANINVGGIKFQNDITAQGREIPFQFNLAEKNDNQWRITGTGISMVAPAPLVLSGFNATIKRNAATFEGAGDFTGALHPSTQNRLDPMPVRILDPLPLQGRFAATYHPSGKWRCEVSNSKSKTTSAQTVRLFVEPYTITSSIPEFNLSAKSESGFIDAEYLLTAPGIRIASASESIHIPKLILKGTAQTANETNRSARVKFDLQAPNTGLHIEGGEIKIPDVALSGELNANDVRQITLGGVMQFAGAGGRFSRLNAQLSGARGNIPFKWPVKGKTATGSVSIANLKYKGLNFGGLKSHIRQTSTGFTFEGQHQSKLLPQMKLSFTGESSVFRPAPFGTLLHVKLTRPGSAPAIDLGKFFPDAAGVRLNGKFQLEGDLALNTNGFSARIRADFDNGNLLMDKNKLAIEGIRLSLVLPELPKIRSAPGQQIHFTKISLGGLVAQKGRIDFQIESNRSLMIEKIHFIWCEGNVETQAMRLSPGVEDYNITFHCDRLNLAKVLEQFGAAAASGRGTVNGRIPLQYAHGKIRFNDGFLFSTPGEGGKIHVTGTDILTAGIPPGTNQFVQMELAREALKDYDYSWAKLNITSEGEELIMKMQMDGKPAKSLPFVYRKDIGGFMKVEAEAKGSKFQGIRLDVNFRLPLNKLLQYKDLIDMMQ